jgi:Domain of unknown function (DUF4157)
VRSAHPLLELQRQVGNRATVQLVETLSTAPESDAVGEASSHRSLSAASGGHPLSPELGLSLGFPGLVTGGVVVHDDMKADEAANALGALAVTAGSHVYFAAGQYQPRSVAGRRLIAHELAHVVQQKGVGAAQVSPPLTNRRWELEANAVADAAEKGQRLPPVTPDPRGVVALQEKSTTTIKSHAHAPKVLDGMTMIASQYPHLAAVLTAHQIAQVQRVLDARAKLKRLGEEAAPLEQSVLSEDVPKWERIQAQSSAQRDVLRDEATLVIPTQLLLADDVRHGTRDSAQEQAFRQQLFAEMTAHPVLVTLTNASDTQLKFEFRWGPGRWALSNQGGMIRFEDLMRVEALNVAYQERLLKREVEVLGEMEQLAYEGLSPEGRLEVLIKQDDLEFDPAVLDPAGHALVDVAALRSAYTNGNEEIYEVAKMLLDKGRSIDEVADWAVEARNVLKQQIRDEGPRILKVLAEARNMREYGNPFGPSGEQLRAGGRSSEGVIEGVVRSNPGITRWAGRLRIAGKIMIWLDVAIASYKVVTAPKGETMKVIVEELGAIGSAVAGAAVGAKGGGFVGGVIGALGGPETIPVGIGVGEVVGGIGGAVVGAVKGRKAAQWLAKKLFPPAETRFEGEFH